MRFGDQPVYKTTLFCNRLHEEEIYFKKRRKKIASLLGMLSLAMRRGAALIIFEAQFIVGKIDQVFVVQEEFETDHRNVCAGILRIFYVG